jgi:hypothetical protein
MNSKNIQGQSDFCGAEIASDQKKWGIGQPRNFKNCGQRESYFGSPESEIDLAIVGLKVKIGFKLNL